MPTITVDRQDFFRRLGKEYTTDEFDALCFDYGLELDEDTTQDPDHPKDEPHKLKIETPANRYDLLCIEGIARALKLYLHPEIGPPKFTLRPAPEGQERVVKVSADTARIRPYFASAILRNVKFNKLSYDSFIDLQDKLHSNLARRRTLVAIGTHDLDKIAPGVISYEALPPRDIRFVPLNKGKEYNAEEMMQMYKEDKHLSKFLHIIEDSPVYPIIYSSTRQVLSMPPIINSNETKITLDTTNIFIDMTATDETKLQTVIDMLTTMFSEYCSEPFIIEPVRIEYSSGSPGGARTILSPPLATRPFVVRTSYVNACTGLHLERPQVIELLQKMGHEASVPSGEVFKAINSDSVVAANDQDLIHVLVPPTRPDILHECDLMEEAAVAYGFNNLTKTFPRTSTVARPFPLNKLSDILRRLCSESGWTEVLPLTLSSHDENFKHMNRKDPGDIAVVLANPKTIEYQIVRTSLLPGILKTIRENRKLSLPLRVFEVGDIVLKDSSVERQARNERHLGAVFCGRKAGFEVVHGLLDRIMLGLGIPNILNSQSKAETGYYIKASDDETYFPNRSAQIYLRTASKGSVAQEGKAKLAPLPSADASNASVAAEGENEGNGGDDKKQGPLDTIKEKLSAALPHHHSKADASSATTGGKDVVIGELGILHPSVLKAFELDFPCSSLEFNVEPFL